MSQPNSGPASQGTETETGDQESQTETRSTSPEVAAARHEAQKLRAALRKVEAELASAKTASMTEQDKAVSAAREEGAAKFKTLWKEGVVANAALSLLGDKGVTATDLAVRALNLSAFDVDDQGEFDREQLKAAVDDLINRYPMLVATTSSTGSNGSTSVTSATGDGQQRITREAVLSATKKSESDAVNDMLRYALGRRSR